MRAHCQSGKIMSAAVFFGEIPTTDKNIRRSDGRNICAAAPTLAFAVQFTVQLKYAQKRANHETAQKICLK